MEQLSQKCEIYMCIQFIYLALCIFSAGKTTTSSVENLLKDTGIS